MTNDRPLMIDLFGGIGLAAIGFARAGFRVKCVENDPNRIAEHVSASDDPAAEHIEAVEGNAITYPLDGADAVAASPPCTSHTTRAPLADHTRGRKDDTGWMLPYTLARLDMWARDTGGVYVVENVGGAKGIMRSPLLLCGTMFDLVDEGWHLERHRLFQSNVPLMAPGFHRCRGKYVRTRPIGVYGDLTVNDRACGGKRRPGGDMRAGVARARRLMGVGEWASPDGLKLGLPPAYTHYLGEQIMPYVIARAAA
jgi:DNA (cytosine-5)-methyltransferase 1